MPVRSLLDLASLACIKHIRHLDSVGDYLPYDTLRHILLKVENAHQLRRIELNSPQIEGRTGEIWLRIIERDFPLEFRSKAYKPQNPSKWYRVWEKYKRDHDRSVEESEMKLRNAMAGLQEARERNTSKIVERKLLPRKGATGPRRGGHRDTSGSTLNFTGGTRTKTSSGASVMRKVRREANEIASIKGSLSRAISLPQRRPAQAVLKKAPQSMIDDRRRAAQPSPAPPLKALAPPRVPSAVKLHEERATFISDSEEDEVDPDGDATTGGVDKKRPVAKATTKVVTKTAPKVPTSSGLRRAAAASLLKTRPSTATKAATTSRIAEQGPRPVGTGPISVKDLSSTVKPGASSPERHPPKTPRLPDQDGPNPAQLGAGSPPPRPPKRRAPDIFMRPKKRPH
jgi:elongin-A